MPSYEYQCSKCEKIHEVIQKFSDAPLAECPECGGQVTKLLSLTSFALKGSGWYTSDYKRSSGTSESSSAAKSTSESKSSGESKPSSESKPSAKPSSESKSSSESK